MCGENDIRQVEKYYDTGSPPRVRGKHPYKFLRSRFDGITPACAGKTLLVLERRKNEKDHPRVCGENFN